MSLKVIKFASVLILLLTCITLIGEVSAKASNDTEANNSDNMSFGNATYWKPVENAMGEKGKISPDGGIVFSIPMTLNVSLDGVELNPGTDRSHEFDFMKAGNGSMMEGEIGVPEEEVANVTDMALQSGFEVTGMHNHLIRLSPHIMWIHIYGDGNPVRMAENITEIVDYVNGNSSADQSEESLSEELNTSELDEIIGDNGSVEGGDWSYDIPRADKIRMNGFILSQVMDTSSLIFFQPLGDGNAAVTGEFTLEADEIEPVMKVLRNNDVEVTALHNHMLTEQPRLFYMHFWAEGNATELADTMRQALDETNSEI